jgi:hypothetical protein
MSAPSLKTYRVVVIEWLSHKAIIEAASPEEAESEAYRMFADNSDHQVFQFDDSGVDGVTVDELES